VKREAAFRKRLLSEAIEGLLSGEVSVLRVTQILISSTPGCIVQESERPAGSPGTLRPRYPEGIDLLDTSVAEQKR
jgi:hypothetical protein